METVFEQRFDPRRRFQYVNDEPSVLHCHHYITIFTRLAIEMAKINGPKLLMDAMEETFYLVLRKYYIRHNVTDENAKVGVAQDYFSLTGMGMLKIHPGREKGLAEMSRSHVDEGWLKKWEKTDYPINYVGCGYIAAVFALLNDLPLRSYKVEEVEGIAAGSKISRFSVRLEKEAAQ